MEVTTETRKTHLPSNGNWLSKYLVAALVSLKVDIRANAHVACNVKELWLRGKCNLSNDNGAIPPLKIGNSPLPLGELMVHYSLTKKIVKFCLLMKDCKWGRKLMFINCTSLNKGLLQIPFEFPNQKLPISNCRGLTILNVKD